MKPFILFVWLCVLCSYQPLIAGRQNDGIVFIENPRTADDFGTYLETDPVYGHRIVIRANYYVSSKQKADSIAAQSGVDCWNALSGKFFLKVMDEKLDFTGEKYPFHFDLKVFSCKDPEYEWKLNEKKRKNGDTTADIRNVLLLVQHIKNGINNCRVTDIDRSIGLTCEAYHIRLRKTHQGVANVIAHEIGHTLGLDHADLDGLMQEFDRKGTDVFEFEIQKILAFSYRHRLNRIRNNFDKKIPSGLVQHASGSFPKHSDSCVLFLNGEFRKTTD
jgi:hypothetical protein